MESLQIHADRTLPALVDGARLTWTPSPERGVDRRMLERSGDEVAIASTIVRYARGSRFAPHTHGLGEEFLVLEGTFSDGAGDYPTGTYVRNPPGSIHAPFSANGCVIFVKLRQMAADEPEMIRRFPADRAWIVEATPGRDIAPLYDNGRTVVTLERLRAGAELPAGSSPGGREIFVVEGSLALDGAMRTHWGTWSWLRHPGARQPSLVSVGGALVWVKRGHLM